MVRLLARKRQSMVPGIVLLESPMHVEAVLKGTYSNAEGKGSHVRINARYPGGRGEAFLRDANVPSGELQRLSKRSRSDTLVRRNSFSGPLMQNHLKQCLSDTGEKTPEEVRLERKHASNELATLKILKRSNSDIRKIKRKPSRRLSKRFSRGIEIEAPGEFTKYNTGEDKKILEIKQRVGLSTKIKNTLNTRIKALEQLAFDDGHKRDGLLVSRVKELERFIFPQNYAPPHNLTSRVNILAQEFE